MTLDDLVNEFADCVAAQSRAIASADSKKGNMFADRYIAAFDELRSRGNAGRDALETLFADPRTEVRVMAAAYLLRHSGQRARAVLEAAAKEKGLVGFGAVQALKRWDDGTWALDPE